MQAYIYRYIFIDVIFDCCRGNLRRLYLVCSEIVVIIPAALIGVGVGRGHELRS